MRTVMLLPWSRDGTAQSFARSSSRLTAGHGVKPASRRRLYSATPMWNHFCRSVHSRAQIDSTRSPAARSSAEGGAVKEAGSGIVGAILCFGLEIDIAKSF